MRGWSGFALLLVLSACGGASTSQTEAAEPRAQAQPAVTFRFGWKPGRVAVVERVEKKGVPATLGYMLVIEAHGEELWVSYQDIHFWEIAGRDASDPAVRAEIEPLEEQMRHTPMGMRIDRSGKYLGLVDLEAVSAAARKLSKDDNGALDRALANPKVRAMLERAAGKPWQPWVAAWRDLMLSPGQVIEGDVEHELAPGVTVSEHMRFEHLGSEPARPGLVRVRCQGTIDDPRFASGLGVVLDELVPEAKGDAKLEKALHTATGRRRLTFEAVIDPVGLQPAWARSAEETSVVIEGRAHEAREVHEWTFTPVP